MHFQEIGAKITARRKEVGLSSAGLAYLASLPQQSVAMMEHGELADCRFASVMHVLWILGLTVDISSEPRKQKNGLWMAARNASVTYKLDLTADELRNVLTTGEPLKGKESNLIHFLEETPLQLAVMAIEEAATSSPSDDVWNNVANLCQMFGIVRLSWTPEMD